MKRLTIDASVALKFLLDEPGSDEARQFYSEEKDGRFAVSNVLLSPTLVLLEVHNTLAKRFHNTNIDVSIFTHAAFFLRQMIAFSAVDESLVDRARQLSMVANVWSGRNTSKTQKSMTFFNIYDCIYIAHAQTYQTTLVTADKVQAEIAYKAFSVPVHLISTSPAA
jgi:predicted nucleic acid-binding protein